MSVGLIIILVSFIGTEIFPKTDAGQAVVRVKLPVGTRLERTEDVTKRVLQLADSVSQSRSGNHVCICGDAAFKLSGESCSSLDKRTS
ncbi:MAG: hypothetical protein U5K54_11795 [Cytophagales bacterium]|nr:hypothetical protein [Cytophagales bacterium]